MALSVEANIGTLFVAENARKCGVLTAMERLYLARFQEAMTCVVSAIRLGYQAEGHVNYFIGEGLILEEYQKQLLHLVEGLNALGLRIAATAATRALRRLHPNCRVMDLVGILSDIPTRMMDELEGTLILVVDRDLGEYYESGIPLFGQTVADSFPSAISDLIEAGNCLALERGTACVFHLMRVMEVGLKELARELGIPYAPSWESYIKQINTNISEKHQHKTIDWINREPFFRDVVGDLTAVKIAWRNPTMHIVRTYTPREAKNILEATKAFMQRLQANGISTP